MKSCYVTHTKVAVFGDRLFDDSIIYAEGFKRIFNEKLCLSSYVKEIRLKNCPKIDDLGYVYLDKKNVNGNGNEEILLNNQDGCSLFCKNDYSKDERLSYFYFELYKPLNILAFKNGIKAKGKIFIHFFPFGCVSLTIALSLKGIKDINSDELKTIVNDINPNKSQDLWKWRCKWGDMSLRNIIAKIENKITKSLFISFNPKSVDFNSKWYTSYTYTEIDTENSEDHSQAQNSFIVVKNNVIDVKNRMVFLFDNENFRQKQLRTYWRVIRIQELVLIKNTIYAVFEHHLKKEILKLRNNRLGYLKENFSNKYWKKSTVYNNDLATFIQYTDDIILNSYGRYRYLYAKQSEYFGLNKKRKDLIKCQKEWIEECDKYKNPIINKIIEILPFLSFSV